MSQPGCLPTSTDANRVIDRLNDAPEDAPVIVPSGPTIISYAGGGSFGDVYFCLPHAALTDAQSVITPQTDVATVKNTLTEKLIALKIADCGDYLSTSMLKNEIQVLQVIRKTNRAAGQAAVITEEENAAASKKVAIHSAHNPKLTTSGAFFEILDSETGSLGDTHFLTTTTLPLICTLDALKPHLLTLPEAFTWLLYLEVSKALTWLNETCKPGIAYGDLHWGNILIGYPSFDPEEGNLLPQVKLIDFGKSIIHGEDEGFVFEAKHKKTIRDDKGHLIGILNFMLNIVMSGKPARSQDLRGLRHFIRYAAKCRDDEKESQFSELNQRFKKLAEEQLEDVTQADCVGIWESVMEITTDRRGKVMGKIEELLQAGAQR